MYTDENPSQAVICSQKTGPPAIDTRSPSVAALYNSLRVADMSVTEFVSNIRSFVHSSSWIDAARNLQGEEAQGIIDLIDQALTLPEPELDAHLRKQVSHLVYKLCRGSELLPASFFLQQEHIRVGNIRCCGGFADIREGEYLGRHVAIKSLRFGMNDSDKIFKRFCQEIIGWRHLLSHPNVLPLLGVSVSADPQSFCIISDWMQNGNVMEYTRSNPEVNRLRLLSDVMSGATYLHELGIVHGDLKGANILVDHSGAARLADFGLMAISVELSTVPLSATTVSSAGTVRWTSPELLFGSDSSPTRESDSYALGMVVYEVLTGLRPFHYLSHHSVVIVVQRGERPRKPENAASLGFSDTLWSSVQLCWSEPPSARPTAQELLRHFQDPSHAWVPPPEYPISDVFDGGAGVDLTSGDEWSVVVGALESSLFVLVVLCLLLSQLS